MALPLIPGALDNSLALGAFLSFCPTDIMHLACSCFGGHITIYTVSSTELMLSVITTPRALRGAHVTSRPVVVSAISLGFEGSGLVVSTTAL